MSPQELARLVDRYGAPLVLFARQWCATPEDIVQDAFVKLVTTKKPPDQVGSWLYRVVRNGAIDAGKSERRRQKRESEAARPLPWFVEPEIDGLEVEKAMSALQSLPGDQREVIVSRLWGGLSFEEIAEVFECSQSTAFRRFNAGVETLRQLLGVSSCPNQS